MLQSAYMLEQMSRQTQDERVAEASRVRVRALLASVRKDRKAPTR